MASSRLNTPDTTALETSLSADVSAIGKEQTFTPRLCGALGGLTAGRGTNMAGLFYAI